MSEVSCIYLPQKYVTIAAQYVKSSYVKHAWSPMVLILISFPF